MLARLQSIAHEIEKNKQGEGLNAEDSAHAHRFIAGRLEPYCRFSTGKNQYYLPAPVADLLTLVRRWQA